MRGQAVALVVLLAAAGCLAPAADVAPLALADVPEGALVETIDEGLRLVFDAVDLPFSQNVTVPEGTTLVRARVLASADESVSVTMRHAETLRRRCNFAALDAWDAPVRGEGVCSGVTLVDRLPATWEVRASSSAGTGRVEVELLTVPLDGALAGLDVSQISHRDHELRDTEVLSVPSFDGTALYVEVTRPVGEGPWPVVIWSSPYEWATRLGGTPSAWAYFVKDWAARGYAVVTADVRGYGESEGCVGVWDSKEQQDQVFLVEWAAKQPWSDGNVGFWGQSYVGTTPVEAAVNAPDALKAIVAVAPVTDAYTDWHFGGVPNGEGTGSSLAYYGIGGGVDLPGVPRSVPRVPTAPPSPPTSDELAYATARADNGFCDPTVAARASDPRGVYDAFYVERNFSARAGDVKAAVLYTQGFEDSNVKPALIPDWFGGLDAPRLGLFGHWTHQHPTRADNEALFLLWFDQHLKGKPVGFDAQPPVRVTTNDGRETTYDAWPPPPDALATFPLDPAGGALAEGGADATIVLDALAGHGLVPVSLGTLPLPTGLALEGAPLAAPLRLAGAAAVRVEGTLEGAENGHVAAYLYEDGADGAKLVTWGMFNIAHRNGHDRYDPVVRGEVLGFDVPLLPTEWTFAEGSTLRLVLRGAAVHDWYQVGPTEPGRLTLHADGSLLRLPTVAGEGAPTPRTAMR